MEKDAAHPENLPSPTTWLSEAPPIIKEGGDPKWFPTLRGGDYCKDSLSDGQGRCCLQGWINWVFFGDPHTGEGGKGTDGATTADNYKNRTEARKRFSQCIIDAANAKAGSAVFSYEAYGNQMYEINDADEFTADDLAEIWNAGARRFQGIEG